MWLPDAHLCYLILKAARPCVAVLLHGAATSSAISPQMHQQNPADAPPESRGTIRIRRTPTESCLHLQRAIDHHGPSIYSGRYTTSVNCCNRTFYCNDNKITEFDMINTKNSSTAYVVIYKLIT